MGFKSLYAATHLTRHSVTSILPGIGAGIFACDHIALCAGIAMSNVSAQGAGTQEFDCKNAIGTATDVQPAACLQPPVPPATAAFVDA